MLGSSPTDGDKKRGEEAFKASPGAGADWEGLWAWAAPLRAGIGAQTLNVGLDSTLLRLCSFLCPRDTPPLAIRPYLSLPLT